VWCFQLCSSLSRLIWPFMVFCGSTWVLELFSICVKVVITIFFCGRDQTHHMLGKWLALSYTSILLISLARTFRLCWIKVVRVSILALFQIWQARLLVFHWE
jgi:hypothetical protein